MFQKYFRDAGSSFSRTTDKEYSSFGIIFSIANIWLSLIKWWFRYIIFSQFPLLFKTANFHGLGIACIGWNHLPRRHRTHTERTQDVQKASRTSSERLMYVQFTSCVYWGCVNAETTRIAFPQFWNSVAARSNLWLIITFSCLSFQSFLLDIAWYLFLWICIQFRLHSQS